MASFSNLKPKKCDQGLTSLKTIITFWIQLNMSINEYHNSSQF